MKVLGVLCALFLLVPDARLLRIERVTVLPADDPLSREAADCLSRHLTEAVGWVLLTPQLTQEGDRRPANVDHGATATMRVQANVTRLTVGVYGSPPSLRYHPTLGKVHSDRIWTTTVSTDATDHVACRLADAALDDLAHSRQKVQP